MSFGSVPSADTDQISFGIPDLTKTIRRPFGDHAGEPCPPVGTPAWVTGTGSPPRAGTTQIVDGGIAMVAITSLISRDWNATSEPSGDHDGSEPNSESCFATPPDEGKSQMPPRFIE